MVGFYSRMSYPAGADDIRFYSVEFRGDWEYEDLVLASEFGKAETRRGYSADTIRYTNHFIGNESYMVLGWRNMTRNEGGWVALALDENNACMYFADTGSAGQTTKYATTEWLTNGHRIQIRFTSTGDGGVEWMFMQPE
jgi:hypothetical protein